MNKKISIIGAGAWGTALAQAMADKGAVTLWTRNHTHADAINAERVNKRYLPNITLDERITATSDLQNALQAEILLLVPPAQALRQTLANIKPLIKTHHKIVLCCKGLETNSALFMTDIADEIVPTTPIAVLSGPNFASDIAAGKPAATTLACEDEEIAKELQQIIATPLFRPYITTDIIGVEIAGALKNVIAIACGISSGLNMGESARASLITRGLAEISRLGIKMGAAPETFLGLSGVGDMMLTCSSEQSRNFSLGFALGKGENIQTILKSRTSVTEGIHTAESAEKLSNKYAMEMPICETIHKCLNQGLSIKTALNEIMNRPLSHE